MQRVEVSIERLAKTGEGVARAHGRALFVAGALPGERVLVELAANANPPRAAVVKVLEASPDRRAPQCPLATQCGGCDWLHVELSARRRHKEEIVLSALRHVARLPDTFSVRPTVGSTADLGTRRRAVLHPVGGGLGYFAPRSHAGVEVERCPALTPGLVDLPGRLARALQTMLGDLDEVRFLEVGGRGEGQGQVAFSVHLRGRARDRHRECLTAAVGQLGLSGAVLVPAAPLGSRESSGPVELFGAPTLTESGLKLRPDAFAQAEAEVSTALVRCAVEQLRLSGIERVLELYSGNGNFTFEVAAKALEVVAVEVNGTSSTLAQGTDRPRGNVRFIEGDAAEVAAGLTKGSGFQRLLLDPPRTGARGVGRWALGLGVERVVYVACDPLALARDAQELSQCGYVPESLQLFDLFPLTHHVEALMAFAREGAGLDSTRPDPHTAVDGERGRGQRRRRRRSR